MGRLKGNLCATIAVIPMESKRAESMSLWKRMTPLSHKVVRSAENSGMGTRSNSCVVVTDQSPLVSQLRKCKTCVPSCMGFISN